METDDGSDIDQKPGARSNSSFSASFSSLPSTPSSQVCASTPSSSQSRIKKDPDETIRNINEGIAGIKTEASGGTKPPLSPAATVKEEPKFELSDKQKEDIKETFSTLDSEGSGFIKIKDLKIAMRGLGFEPRSEEVKKISAQVDKNSSGLLSYNDFTTLITTKLAEKDSRAEISKAFKLFDRDQAGKITFNNLQQIAGELGEVLTEEEIREMITEADLDGDGAVNPDEFFRIMKKTSLY